MKPLQRSGGARLAEQRQRLSKIPLSPPSMPPTGEDSTVTEPPAVSKGGNTGRSLIEQARKKKPAQPVNTIDLSTARLSLTRIERGVDEKTGPWMRLIWASRSQWPADLSFLLALPNLCEPLGEGLRLATIGKKPATQRVTIGEVRRGLVQYLTQRAPAIDLEGIDEAMLRGFQRHVDNAYELKPRSRKSRLSAAQRVFEALLGISRYAQAVTKILDVFPRNTHPGAHLFTQSFGRLSREHLESVDKAAQSEAAALMHRWEESKQLLEHGTALLDAGCRDYKVFSVALAAMARRYQHVLPTERQLMKDDRALSGIVCGGKEAHRLGKIADCLYIGSRDLVPFVILIVLETGFNPDSVLGLKRVQIRRTQRRNTETLELIEDDLPAEGQTHTTLVPTKGRSKPLAGKDLDPYWVGPWFKFLEEATARLRPVLDSGVRDRVFCFGRRYGSNKAMSAAVFTSSDEVFCGSKAWQEGLKSFRRDHDLPQFTLVNLRKSIGDEVGLRWGSVAQSQSQDHASFQTTERHYIGSPVMEREQEALGHTVHMYERYLTGAGQTDTRRSARTASMDRMAATPGYTCLAPYDSPRPRQHKGRLCTAYGECPSCPLGAPDFDDPYSVSYHVALRDQIVSAQCTMTPRAWLERWAPVLVDLDAQLKHVTREVLQQAVMLRVTMAPVS